MPKNSKLKITLVHKNGPQPDYATDGSSAIDLATTEPITIRPFEYVAIPTNVIVEYPDGYTGLVILRSSVYKKHGLIMPSAVGLIDSDYNGKNDVVLVPVLNLNRTSANILAGERIAQLLFVKSDRLPIEIGEFATDKSRGGLGSTG